MNQQIANHNNRFLLHHSYRIPMQRSAFLVFLTIVFLAPVFAQDIVFTASAPDSVNFGEEFTVGYTVDQNADSIRIESFENFELISGPYKSSSSTVTVINGEVKKSYQNSFTYELKPVKKGVFRVPVASIQVKGKKYFSDTLLIIIKDALQKQQPDSTDEISPNDLYIDLTVSKQEVYVQEPVIATLKLYSKYSLSAIDNIELPGCDNFLSYNISDSIITPQKETVKGNTFTTVTVKKILLYPLTSGEFQVGGGKFICTVQKPSTKKRKEKSVFDDWFSPPYKTMKRSLEINTHLLTIKPLPEKLPIDSGHFCGTDINIKDSVTTNKIKTHIPFDYEITLSGKGNLKFATPPNLNLPAECKMVSQHVSNNLACDKDGFSGFRTFHYTIVPEQEGKLIIPAHSFRYFDLEAKEYKTISTNPVSVNIEKDRSAPVSSKYSMPLPNITKGSTEESNLMIVMDVSASMFARDLKPNRLESSVNASKKFLQQLKGKAGIIIFSEDSKVKCTLRSNLKVVSDSMNAVSKSDLGNGTAIGFGICNATQELKKSNAASKAIVLITDGANNMGSVSPKMAARLSGSFGIKVFVIGVSGKDSLAEYPYKTSSGTEISTLPVNIDENTMNELANSTGGKYFRAFDNHSFNEIYKEIGRLITPMSKNDKFNSNMSAEEAERILDVVAQDIEEVNGKVKKQ